ncbi:MAG: hypothetical protein GY928_21540 [Colwellia sp.]|nr:hypothetical protein [Colwellia sp.]
MSDKEYKHKYYNNGDMLETVIKDYPIVETCGRWATPSSFSLDAERMNKLIDEDKYKSTDELGADLVNGFLDMLEEKGKL